MAKGKKAELKNAELKYKGKILKLQLKTSEFCALEEALELSIWEMIVKFQDTKSGLGFRELTNILFCGTRKTHPDLNMSDVDEIIENSELPVVVNACVDSFLQGLKDLKIIPEEAKK